MTISVPSRCVASRRDLQGQDGGGLHGPPHESSVSALRMRISSGMFLGGIRSAIGLEMGCRGSSFGRDGFAESVGMVNAHIPQTVSERRWNLQRRGRIRSRPISIATCSLSPSLDVMNLTPVRSHTFCFRRLCTTTPLCAPGHERSGRARDCLDGGDCRGPAISEAWY